MVSQELKQRLTLDGAVLEYEIVGAGEPVVLIHGALIAEAYAPLCAEPALARYSLLRYHRRGYAGSSPVPVPFSIVQQAADCRGLMRGLGIERAHVVGHSSGGVIALQLALAAPEVVHSLVLLEPALVDNVPSGPLIAEAIGPVLQMYQAGNKEGAMDGFLRVAIGPAYRSSLDELIPGGYEQARADADTFFAVELPSQGEWRFTREDAGRITQPVLAVLGGESVKDWAGWPEIHALVQEWMPQAEPFVLAGSNHALEEMDPRGVATAMAAFFARHPMPTRA